MRAFGQGILPEESQIYLYDASQEAKQLFFHALCIGHYHCDRNYRVDREAYNSFLLVYVASGTFYYAQDGKRRELGARSFCLVDCYRHHLYGTEDQCEIYWTHLDGPAARAVYEKLKDADECIPRHFERCRNGMLDLCRKSEAGGHIPEAEVNRILTSILMEFLMGGKTVQQHTAADAIEEVRMYIDENPEKELGLDALAERAQLSPYHFLRRFREQVGTTPNEYLVQVRMNVAAFYLISSDYSVKEIAFSCGFSGLSNFCTSFRKKMGITPSEYRILHTRRKETGK